MSRNISDQIKAKIEKTAEDLKKRIEAGEFPTGTLLPTTEKLMEQYPIYTRNDMVCVREILRESGYIKRGVAYYENGGYETGILVIWGKK